MIVSCGEALIDFVPMEGKNGEFGYKPCEGGSPFNVAIGLGRLDVPTGFLGRISTDFFGDLLMRHLDRNGVDTSLVLRGSENTTLGFVSLPKDGGEPQYAFVATGSADRTVSLEDFPDPLPEDATVLQFGSISLVQEPGATAFEALMRREAGRRVLVLDPNVRPGLISDRDAYIARLESWIALMDLVRASVVDIEWLYPGESLASVAERWAALGPNIVVFTLGEEGAVAWSSAGETQVPGVRVTMADTVGAGDSFFSGFLGALHRSGNLTRDGLPSLASDDLSAALAFGCRCAGITCSRDGADPPWSNEVA